MSGKTDQIKGRIEEATGALMDNERLKRKGKVDQAVGKVKEAADRVVDKVKDAAEKAVDKMKDALTSNRPCDRANSHIRALLQMCCDLCCAGRLDTAERKKRE